MAKEVILTGIRSNEELTLGNYLGAFLPMIELQKQKVIHGDHQLNMFVPDLHSFTTPVDHKKLYASTLRNLKSFVAAGLDINNVDTFIYRQSYIPAHSELTVILNNFAYFGELSRMTQFKEKSEKEKEHNISAGLFDYPVLMAADILLYGSHWIPVGEDQTQHIEFTRDLAMRINKKFGEIFVVPYDTKKQLHFHNKDRGVRIRSLRSPEKKMSKSVSDPAGTILLSDKPADAGRKVISATTDSIGKINLDFDKQPGISNLLQILALLQAQDLAETAKKWAGGNSYGDLKMAVAEAVSEFLSNFQGRLATLNESELIAKLEDSERQMSEVANLTLERVQRAVGLRP